MDDGGECVNIQVEDLLDFNTTPEKQQRLESDSDASSCIVQPVDDDGDSSDAVNISTTPATDVVCVALGSTAAAAASLATELTEDEIRDVEEMESAAAADKLSVSDELAEHQLLVNVCTQEDQERGEFTAGSAWLACTETDVDDIMGDQPIDSDRYRIIDTAAATNNKLTSSSDDEKRKKDSFIDDDDDDDDEVKEVLVFKRQNSRDFLDQTPLEGLLEGIAEEQEEEVAKEIEEEYDSVVILNDDEEDIIDEKLHEKTDATVISSEINGADDTPADTAETPPEEEENKQDRESILPLPSFSDDTELHRQPTPNDSNLTADFITSKEELSVVEKQLCEDIVETGQVDAEPVKAEQIDIEPMETSSPSTSETTSGTDDNAGTADDESEKLVLKSETTLAEAAAAAAADELIAFENGTTQQDAEKQIHDYVNIDHLLPSSTTAKLNGEATAAQDLVAGDKMAARAEISEDDFRLESPVGFDGAESRTESRETSCDYVNVNTIRANKRLASRLLKEGNDEEFERLEAEIISKLDSAEEEDSDYCVPRSTSVEKKLDNVVEVEGHSALISLDRNDDNDSVRSAAIDENDNLPRSDQRLGETEASLFDEQSNLSEPSNEKSKEDEPKVISAVDAAEQLEPAAAVTSAGETKSETVSKENGLSTSTATRNHQKEDSDSEASQDYKHPKKYNIPEPKKDSWMTQRIERDEEERSNDHTPSNMLSPKGEMPHGSRVNDILPEAGCVKALVAQWQQLENKRWSRRDDIPVQNGIDQPENRGMNRSRSCGPLPRKVRVLSPDGGLDEEGRRIREWTVVGGNNGQQYDSHPSLTRAMLVKFERLDYETSTSVHQTGPKKKTYKWEVKEPKILSRPSFLAH